MLSQTTRDVLLPHSSFGFVCFSFFLYEGSLDVKALHQSLWRRAADAGSSDATAPSGVGEQVRMCGVTLQDEGPTSESCFELGCFVLGWVGWVGCWRVGLFRVRLGRRREW